MSEHFHIHALGPEEEYGPRERGREEGRLLPGNANMDLIDFGEGERSPCSSLCKCSGLGDGEEGQYCPHFTMETKREEAFPRRPILNALDPQQLTHHCLFS